MDYNIRFANCDDSKKIMNYIDCYWKKNHILSRDEMLLRWQYGFYDKYFSVVVGEDKNGKIQGILGYITYSNTKSTDIALALWKANEGTGFLGILLLKFLLTNVSHRYVFCTGINPISTEKIYKSFGFNIDEMRHWYRLCEKDEYIVPLIKNKIIPESKTNNGEYTLRLITSMSQMELFFDFNDIKYISQSPFKSKEYIFHRYFSHPTYSYLIYTVHKDGDVNANCAIVFRLQEAMGTTVLRFIDCIGNLDLIYEVMHEIDELIIATGAEYVDMYECGLDISKMKLAGWLEVIDSENIIPDWFSPFEQKNVTIFYASDCDNAVLFKGDGDQDRPN